jgi:hypothetical protein
MLITNDLNSPVLPAFSFFTTVWAITMVQYWKRIEKITAMKWNMTGVDAKEIERDDVRYHFYGKTIKSPVTGSGVLHFSSAKRHGLYAVSVLLMLMTIVPCLVSTAALFYLRATIHAASSDVHSYDHWITPAMMSLQITIASRIIYAIAAQLTEWENHRLEPDYDYSLTGNQKCSLFLHFICFCRFQSILQLALSSC